MSPIQNKAKYKKDNCYSPIPKSRIQRGAPTIIALRGCDWNKIHRKDIRKLQRKIGAVLALDDGAIVHALKHGLDVVLIEDFIEHHELIDINKQAMKINYSLHVESMNTHTFDNINFACVDSFTLYYFWQQVLSAYICAKKINDKKLHVILIDMHVNNLPIHNWKNEIFCKVCSQILDSYDIIVLKNTLKLKSTIKKYSFSLRSPIENKPVIATFSNEVKRSIAILDKLKQISKDISIMSCDLCWVPNECHGIAPINSCYYNEILMHIVDEVEDTMYLNSFTAAFEDFKKAINFLPEKLHSTIYQALEFYYTVRYPELLSKYFSYKNLFMKHRPSCVLSTDVPHPEVNFAVLAANTLGIPTITWGHSLAQLIFTANHDHISTFIIHSARGMRNAISNNIPKDRLLLIKDQGERDSLYLTKTYDWKVKKGVIKILVLPACSKYAGTSYYELNYYKKLETLKTLSSPPQNLTVDLKFKEHPGYKDFSIYSLLNIDQKKMVFPVNANLACFIAEADICILVAEIGCALLHASQVIPTLFVSYGMTESTSDPLLNTVNDYPNKVDSLEDIWPWIEKVVKDDSFREVIMNKQRQFNYIDVNTLTFEQAMEEKLKYL